MLKAPCDNKERKMVNFKLGKKKKVWLSKIGKVDVFKLKRIIVDIFY